MGVTIDSLQIEIQSSSTNAAKGLDDLAESLGKLKKNGAFKAVSTNLESLSEALNKLPNVHNASNSLRTLANSIEKLKSVGTVSSLANSLKKLPDALKSVANLDLGRAKSQMQELAEAVAPLSQVKAGGLGTMVNAMKNLGKLNFGEIAKNLDDESIKDFIDRVKVLNEKLGPLSEKMTSIKAGFGAINSKARSASSGVKEFSKEVNATTLNLSSLIDIFRTVTDAIQGIVQKFSGFIAQAIEWDGIAARFGRGFAGQASETYAWIQRLNEEMGINIQEFMKYASVYSTMLTGFGVAAEDAGKMALGYMELTYDIWAGYNDVYGSLEETAEAVKSAIAGEVEPVRRAGFTIVEATLEQTAANHGLKVSLESATEAQKSYLRYLTLIDQAYAQGLVGTYAKEMNTAEGLMRTLAQQLKSLTQAFGSLFLPVLVKILPYIQAFVELLTEGIQALAALFGITIQGVDWSGYNSGASDAIESTEGVTGALNDATTAAKELKNATLGIDELNVISPPSASSGGGAGGGSGGNGFENLDVDSLWDESIFKDINSQVDAIKEKLESWLPVIATIGSAFAALGLGLLIASIGESLAELAVMEGKVAALKRSLAGLAILTIEAVLVFALSDEYLETGNLMYLLGEALTTAVGGYLMYKGFGTKGLIMSLGVSILAQLAAITLNLADGGVEITDPQLWIQSAFTTALAGVGGGILAYKGMIPVSTGKGVGLGLLAGLSLTLSAITIGEITAKGEVTTASIFTGIGSVLAAAGFGFMVGGPLGAAIGAAVGLTINVVGAVVGTVSKNAEKSLKEDLDARFGDITLDKESLEVYIENVTAIPRKVTIDTKVWNDELEDYVIQGVTIPVDAALDIFASEKTTLDSLEKQVYKALETLDTLNIKIAVGVDVTETEYKVQIDRFIESAQGYLDQYYLTTKISLGVMNGDSDGSLSDTLTQFYATNSGELEKLGAQLKSVVSDAFVDGEWIPDKLQEALELQQEIQEILDYVSDVEYRATMQNLSLSVSGNALTADSFKGVLEGATKAIESRLDALDEVKMSQLQVAVMEYDANIAAGVSEAEAKKIYDSTVADIEKAYQDGRVEVTYGTVDFGLDTLQKAFADELKLAESEGWFDIGESINGMLFRDGSLVFDEGNGDRYGNLQQIFFDIEGQIQMETERLSDEVKENMTSLWKALEPTTKEYESIAESARVAGKSVPENVRNGLNDLNELKALSGDVEGINYLMGQGFATDPVFLNTLATAKNAGTQITGSLRDGLLNNLTYVTDEATGLVTGIENSITGEVIAITPTLKENLEQMGVNLSAGVLEGAESEMASQEKSWKDWAIWPWNWFKKENEINSPSKLFERGGKYLVQGLLKGIGNNPIGEKLSEVWGKAKTWWNEKKGSLKSYTPSIGSIYDKLKERWDNARTWWNEKKSTLKTYTPSIGSIYDKLKPRWDNAKNWWNKSKGSLSYTPSIGSIKDKIVSAWNTAKSWWSKNAKLSTKLNISVPKISVKWDTAEAFGKSFRYPTGFSLKFAANGGIFDQGSLIWAGERGPEVMARAAGGKTGVMNVQQMQDAVYEGVYAAVSAAMSGKMGGGSQDVRVYIDGREVHNTVKKYAHEGGATIMGNEVYGY